MRSPRACTLSLAEFPSSFFIQNSRRFVGVVQFLQPRCLCQKQPCTNTTVRYRGSTTSGRPGNFFPWSLNLYPSR